MTTQLLSFANFNKKSNASLLQTPPVGLDGEFIITPLTLELFLILRSLKSGSKFFSGTVSTSIGSASARRMNSGKETQ